MTANKERPHLDTIELLGGPFDGARARIPEELDTHFETGNDPGQHMHGYRWDQRSWSERKDPWGHAVRVFNYVGAFPKAKAKFP